jgi:CheY-like chemotaxis protein
MAQRVYCAARMQRHRLAGLRVVLVDDDADGLEIARVMLEGEGAEVRCAASAEAALRAVSADPPDAVLCDISMPDRDGFWLLREVRALPSGRAGDVPFAALTAHASAATREQVLAAGFAAHLPKPADPDMLVDVVMQLTGPHRGPAGRAGQDSR